MRKITMLLLLLLAACSQAPARAAVNLVEICMTSALAGHAAQECAQNLKYDVPAAASLVLTRPRGSTSQWAADTVWKAWSALAAGDQYRLCPLNITPAVWGVNDPCGTSQTWADVAATAQVINGQAAIAFSWIPPTQDENGGALASGAITGYMLFWGPTARVAACAKPVATFDVSCYPSHAQFLPGTGATLNLPLSASTTLYFALAANSAAGLSAYSVELPITFSLSVAPIIRLPRAPASVTVTATATCDAGPDAVCTLTVK